MLRIKRHELDEAGFHAVVAAELRDGDDVGFVQAFHGDGVQLDGGEAGVAGRFNGFEHAAQVVAARHFEEAFAVERIEMDVKSA